MAAPTERVQVIKQESAGGGGDSADEREYSAPIDEVEDAVSAAGIFLQPVGGAADEDVLLWRESSRVYVKDSQDPSGAPLLSEVAHRALRQLIHFLDEGPAHGFSGPLTKTVTGTVFPTLIEWKDSGGNNVFTKTITRSGGGATNLAPTPIVYRVYASDGTTVLATASDAVTYSGAFETGRTRTLT